MHTHTQTERERERDTHTHTHIYTHTQIKRDRVWTLRKTFSHVNNNNNRQETVEQEANQLTITITSDQTRNSGTRSKSTDHSLSWSGTGWSCWSSLITSLTALKLSSMLCLYLATALLLGRLAMHCCKTTHFACLGFPPPSHFTVVGQTTYELMQNHTFCLSIFLNCTVAGQTGYSLLQNYIIIGQPAI